MSATTERFESQADPEKIRLHNLLAVYRVITRALLHEVNKHGVGIFVKTVIQDALDPDELALLGEEVWNHRKEEKQEEPPSSYWGTGTLEDIIELRKE